MTVLFCWIKAPSFVIHHLTCFVTYGSVTEFWEERGKKVKVNMQKTFCKHQIAVSFRVANLYSWHDHNVWHLVGWKWERQTHSMRLTYCGNIHQERTEPCGEASCDFLVKCWNAKISMGNFIPLVIKSIYMLLHFSFKVEVQLCVSGSWSVIHLLASS